MIVFNEKKYIEKKYINNKNFRMRTMEELIDVIRYYISLGKNVSETNEILISMDYSKSISFCVEDFCWFAAAYTKANARQIYIGNPVTITKYEYDYVRQVGDVEKEKILFMMIVVSKFFKKEVIKLTQQEIKRLSLTQLEKQSLNKAIFELQKDGFIDLYDNKKYKVNLVQKQVRMSKDYICVSDFDHITVPYLKLLKTDKYFFCENCGKKVLYNRNDNKNGKIRKYCPKCATKNRQK